MKIRTGYSFRNAVGKIDKVIARLQQIGWDFAPITDTASTFGYVRWKKACDKAGLKPVFGVELAVTRSIHAKKPAVDFWAFIAKDSLEPIHNLIATATNQFRYQPLLTIEQALAAENVFKIVGHRSPFVEQSEDDPEAFNVRIPAGDPDLYVGLGPALTKGQYTIALELGHQFVATGDNRYTFPDDRAFYETVVGRNASTQTYAQYIMGDDEWERLVGYPLAGSAGAGVALANRSHIVASSTAKPIAGHLLQPERPKPLRQMCEEGAAKLGVDLTDPVYKERMDRELRLIAEKDFEDYFYIIADLCQWSRERMIVGPARGSSCGSLVCYLLEITTVDPIPYGLIFERFIDISRNDLPDIDIDFSDTKRQMAFDYMAEKYGSDHVARLGTVALYKPRSALQEAAVALDVPPWHLAPVLDSILERSGGDARALQATEDTLNDTQTGRDFLKKYPSILVATEMEGHPRHYCLKWDTKVKIGQTNHILKGTMSIKDLWEIFINSPSEDTKRARTKGSPRMPILVSLEEDGRCRPQKAFDIWPAGRKACIRLTMSDGSTVECTPEHKFLIDGEWTPCGKASIGSEFKTLKKRHAGENRRWKDGLESDVVTLVKVEDIGEHETFDIEMPVHHNFVLGNGVITSNSQHAAGIILTDKPVSAYVAVDMQKGSTHCDKKDAEELNLLKIDALGLTQLSIFEDCLLAIGKKHTFLDSIPLNDQKAFDVLNKGHFSGIFQFNGLALQSVSSQIKVEGLEDIISITALARPGPLNTGGTNHWIKVKTGAEPVSYPHPLFEPYLKSTLGVVAYQEQVMEIGRQIGGMSWEDVTALRKAMSKSLGAEFFNKYGDAFKKNAIAKGIPEDIVNKVWDDLCLSGDTRILNPFPSKGSYKYITLKQLYERGGLGPSNGKGGAKRKRQSILMWDGQSLKPATNWGVRYSGKKVTYELITESGNVIRATAEHKFLTPKDGYIELQNLEVGDEVLSDAGPMPTKRKEPKGSGAGGHNWWHKLKAGEPSYEEGRRYLKAMFKKCKHCEEAPYEETHHIDGDHENHTIDNLMPVCRKCHKKLHAAMEGGYHAPWEKGRSVFPDKIVSIEQWGEEDVYDIHMPDPHNNFVAEGIVVHNCAYGSWAFNRSHAVAYGLVSYYCCWLKAHYPMEFAAATLTHTDNWETQIKILREMAAEGIGYIPADKELSTNKWTTGVVDGQKVLVGPLSMVKGIGPKLVSQVMSARKRGEPLPSRALKLLENPKTKIDSLFPVRDRINEIMPDPREKNIFTLPLTLDQVQTTGVEQRDLLVFAVLAQIKPRDENEEMNVVKRNGRRIEDGKTAFLNLRLMDDTDVIFAKVNRWDFEQWGKPIVERGRPGKAIYAIKGHCPPDFRMIQVKMVRYIGDMDDSFDEKEAKVADFEEEEDKEDDNG